MRGAECPLRRRQRGVALLTAMLVVALATMAVVAMTGRQQLDIRRTANVLTGDQAYQLALAVEAYALRLLERPRTPDELPWSGCRSPYVPLDIEAAEITAWLEDMHCRFNLNNLAVGRRTGTDDEPPEPGADPTRSASAAAAQGPARALSDFVALAGAVPTAGAGRLDAERIGRALQDYLDPATDAAVYAAATPSRLSANQPLWDVSELRLVDGVSAAAYRALRPYVTVLPGQTHVRLEGADEPLREALGDADRPAAGADAATAQRSRYFRLAVEVRLGARRSRLCSLLDAEQQRVVQRAQQACGV